MDDVRTHRGQRSSINEDLEEIKTEAMDNSPRGAANGHRREEKERQQIFGSFTKAHQSFRGPEAKRRGGGAGSQRSVRQQLGVPPGESAAYQVRTTNMGGRASPRATHSGRLIPRGLRASSKRLKESPRQSASGLAAREPHPAAPLDKPKISVPDAGIQVKRHDSDYSKQPHRHTDLTEESTDLKL